MGTPQPVFSQFYERPDPQFEKPLSSLDIEEMLANPDLERQKAELFLWLSNAFRSPAGSAPPVMPIPSPAPAQPCEEVPCLLAHKLSLGSSFDSHGTSCDFSLPSTNFGCLTDVSSTETGDRCTSEKFAEDSFYSQGPRTMLLTGKLAYQASPQPDDSITGVQLFEESVHPAHRMIAPPPGFEHLQPRCVPI